MHSNSVSSNNNNETVPAFATANSLSSLTDIKRKGSATTSSSANTSNMLTTPMSSGINIFEFSLKSKGITSSRSITKTISEKAKVNVSFDLSGRDSFDNIPLSLVCFWYYMHIKYYV